jgi:hypothetical protein
MKLFAVFIVTLVLSLSSIGGFWSKSVSIDKTYSLMIVDEYGSMLVGFRLNGGVEYGKHYSLEAVRSALCRDHRLGRCI